MATDLSGILTKMRNDLSKNAAEAGKTFSEAKKEGDKERLEMLKALKAVHHARRRWIGSA